jgi:prepilin-type N-terminal cleavage/methylation domain-containing protein
MFKFSKNDLVLKKGFSLVELIVAVSIISILTGIILTSLSPARGKARDAKKISDIGQIQFALEMYYDRCKAYPDATTEEGPGNTELSYLDNTKLCTTPSGKTVTLSDLISKMPEPIGPGNVHYDYIVSDDRQDYVLHAQLENDNDAIKNRLDDRPTVGFDTSVSVLFDCAEDSDDDGNPIINYCVNSR